jgi:hypothetical protein
MRRSVTPLILGFLTVGAVGCANYAPVASLQRQQQTYLERLEAQLSLDADGRRQLEAMTTATPEARDKLLKEGQEKWAEWYRTVVGSASAASIRAQAKRLAAQADVAARPGDAQAHARMLNAQLAEIQEEFFMESEADALRGRDLAALYLKLVEAVRALRENGVDILRYLELGRLERAWTDVHGMDPEKLKAIGDDLKGIADRLRR